MKGGSGAPCRIRTCGLLVRSQTLYPAELRAHGRGAISIAAFAILPCLLLAAAGAAAQPAPPLDLPQIFGPPPPAPPAVIARDASGGVTVRAVRIDTPLRIDGRLDEAVYDRIEAMSDFIQNDPAEGAPASEKTEIWLRAVNPCPCPKIMT